jgi:hypothetical protein
MNTEQQTTQKHKAGLNMSHKGLNACVPSVQTFIQISLVGSDTKQTQNTQIKEITNKTVINTIFLHSESLPKELSSKLHKEKLTHLQSYGTWLSIAR